MPAKRIDIVIEQGAQFSPTYTWTDDNDDPVDLTGYSARMEIRKNKNKRSRKIIRLTDSDGSIVINGSQGEVMPIINASKTDEMSFTWAWYDLELIPPNNSEAVKRLAKGRVELDKSVTD